MYVLQATSKPVTKETALVSGDKTGSYGIWHRRLGHLHRNGVEKLLSSLNIGVNDAGVSICPTCVSGKIAQKPFKARAPRKLKRNQLLVTMDYVGLMQVNAFDGYNELVNIMVEQLHLELVYPLKSKSSEAQLVALKALNDCIKQLKALPLDHRVVS